MTTGSFGDDASEWRGSTLASISTNSGNLETRPDFNVLLTIFFPHVSFGTRDRYSALPRPSDTSQSACQFRKLAETRHILMMSCRFPDRNVGNRTVIFGPCRRTDIFFD